jgi:hypothetical protein
MKKLTWIIVVMIISFNSFSQLSMNGLHFDGGTQQVAIVQGYTSTNSIDTGNFTIEAWIKDDAPDPGFPSEEPILDNRENSSGGSGFRFAIWEGHPIFFVGPNGIGVGGPDLRDSMCHHVAITRTSGNMHCYVDGQLIGSTYVNYSLYSDAPSLYIGAKANWSGGVWSFNGLIKEIRIWNIARTQSQIQASMGTVLSPNLNLISYWRCNEGSGFTLQDYSGNGNNGTIGAGWSTGCPGCLLPSASITANGSTAFCSPGSVTLNANTGAGLTYQWRKNGINISGATNSSYIATATGNYAVVVTNSCGSVASSATTVSVNALPSAIITPTSPTTFCSGASVVLNAPVANNRSYQWKKGVNLISGATLSSYTATTGGNYKVIVTNTVTGCSKTTGSATVVTVNALPPATITPQGPTTFCAGGSVVLKSNAGTGLTYKWKKGITFISGATFLNYTATTGGNYKVQVTNSNGCSKTSAGMVVSVPCKLSESENENESAFDVKVYPNPNSGEFTITFSNQPTSPIQIELTDELGKVVKRFETNDETVVINESNLAKGIYFLTARNKDEEVRTKISVVK